MSWAQICWPSRSEMSQTDLVAGPECYPPATTSQRIWPNGACFTLRFERECPAFSSPDPVTHSAKDHALAIIKAGINLIPLVGGPIASLIGDYVPTSTQAVIERSTELLAQKLDALKDRIDVEAVNKDDFSELFKSCYLVIVRTNREQKLQAATAILANLLLRPADPAKSSYEELEHVPPELNSVGFPGRSGWHILSALIRFWERERCRRPTLLIFEVE